MKRAWSARYAGWGGGGGVFVDTLNCWDDQRKNCYF